MNRITYLLGGHIRKNWVNCTDSIPVYMGVNVFVKPYALIIVRLILVKV